MSVSEICNRDVVIVRPEESIQTAARLMREYHVGDLIVVKESQGLRIPVGILSDRDIVIEMVAKDLVYDAVNVGDLMSNELLTVQEDGDSLDAIRRMREHGIRRMPVLNKAGALVGILAVDDLIDLIAEQLNNLVGLIGNELRYERERRSG
jgi:CBS domain-containing protein